MTEEFLQGTWSSQSCLSSDSYGLFILATKEHFTKTTKATLTHNSSTLIECTTSSQRCFHTKKWKTNKLQSLSPTFNSSAVQPAVFRFAWMKSNVTLTSNKWCERDGKDCSIRRKVTLTFIIHKNILNYPTLANKTREEKTCKLLFGIMWIGERIKGEQWFPGRKNGELFWR